MFLNFLTFRDIKQPHWFGNHQRSLRPQESLGLVFHLKTLVFIKISNTNKVFPNQTLLANILFLWYFIHQCSTSLLSVLIDTSFLCQIWNLNIDTGKVFITLIHEIHPLLHRIYKRSKSCKVSTLLLNKNIK